MLEINNKDEILDLIDDSGRIEVNHDTWRWGHAVQYYVNYNGNDYLTDYIRYQTDEGMVWDGPIKLHPARKEIKEVWVKA